MTWMMRAGIALCVLALFGLGFALGRMQRRKSCIGALRLDRSDPAEAPYLFLELDSDGVEKLHRSRVVSLRVRIENYIPQK